MNRKILSKIIGGLSIAVGVQMVHASGARVQFESISVEDAQEEMKVFYNFFDL